MHASRREGSWFNASVAFTKNIHTTSQTLSMLTLDSTSIKTTYINLKKICKGKKVISDFRIKEMLKIKKNMAYTRSYVFVTITQ